MSGPTSETVVATHNVRGRDFTVTRLTWANTDGLSFDVADVLTGAPLHDESFDDEPTSSDIDKLLTNLTAQLDSEGEFEDELLNGHVDDLRVVLGERTYTATIKFTVNAFSIEGAETAAQEYVAQHKLGFDIEEL